MPNLSLSEFTEKVSEIMPAISRGFYQQESNEFYKMKITVAQCIVLELIAREGELRMTDLARTMNVTTAAMTGIVERLVRDGYVMRGSDANDRRIIRVRPTSKGSRIVRNISDYKKRIWGKIFNIISQSDREDFLRILTAIMVRLREEGSPARQ